MRSVGREPAFCWRGRYLAEAPARVFAPPVLALGGAAGGRAAAGGTPPGGIGCATAFVSQLSRLSCPRSDFTARVHHPERIGLVQRAGKQWGDRVPQGGTHRPLAKPTPRPRSACLRCWKECQCETGSRAQYQNKSTNSPHQAGRRLLRQPPLHHEQSPPWFAHRIHGGASTYCSSCSATSTAPRPCPRRRLGRRLSGCSLAHGRAPAASSLVQVGRAPPPAPSCLGKHEARWQESGVAVVPRLMQRSRRISAANPPLCPSPSMQPHTTCPPATYRRAQPLHALHLVWRRGGSSPQTGHTRGRLCGRQRETRDA